MGLNNEVRGRKVDSGEGVVKRMEVFSVSHSQIKQEYRTRNMHRKGCFSRACDFPLSPAGSDIRDGRTGVKKRTYVKSECCVRAGFARSKPSG